MADKEEVSSQIASIKNSLYKHNFLSAMYKLVALKKLLVSFNLDYHVPPLIREVAQQNKRDHEDRDTTLIEARLDEIHATLR